MLDKFDDQIPVSCDKNKNNLVTWYNKKTKKLASMEEYSEFPENFADYVRINRKDVEKFFNRAKESLQAFNHILTETIENITKFGCEELSLKASDFLKFTSKVKKLYSYFTDFTEI